MATIHEATIQQTGYEIRKWTADFTDDLPSGGSVTGGTAYHFPPGGGSTVVPSITLASPFVSGQISNVTDIGQHQITIVGTFSNGEKSDVSVSFYLGHPTPSARAGMASIVRKLRSMTNAGVVDYKVGGVPYWTDAQLQEVLDEFRIDFYDVQLQPMKQTSAASVNNSGTVQYKRYLVPYQNLETIDSGTAIFALQYSNGGTVTQALTADYNRGFVNFTNDQGGTALYLSGRSYDLPPTRRRDLAAKSGSLREAYDIETGDKVLTRSQLIKQCLQMAEQYETSGGVETMSVERLDTL